MTTILDADGVAMMFPEKVGAQQWVTAAWGLRPSWNPAQLLINARSETVFETRAFGSRVWAATGSVLKASKKQRVRFSPNESHSRSHGMSARRSHGCQKSGRPMER